MLNENKRNLKITRNSWFDKVKWCHKTDKNREKKTKYRTKKQKQTFAKKDKNYAFSAKKKRKNNLI